MSNTTTQKNRASAFINQGGRCIYCRRPMWQTHLREFAAANGLSKRQAKKRRCTAEHLLARADGGSNRGTNIAAACLFCNSRRHQLKHVLEPKAYEHFVQGELRAGRWAP